MNLWRRDGWRSKHLHNCKLLLCEAQLQFLTGSFPLVPFTTFASLQCGPIIWNEYSRICELRSSVWTECLWTVPWEPTGAGLGECINCSGGRRRSGRLGSLQMYGDTSGGRLESGERWTRGNEEFGTMLYFIFIHEPCYTKYIQTHTHFPFCFYAMIWWHDME